MTKYAPAPWRVKELEGADTPMTEIVDSNGMLVCSTEGQGVDLTHTEDNARLIAASPKMLEVLLYLRDVLTNVSDDTPAWDAIFDTMDGVLAPFREDEE